MKIGLDSNVLVASVKKPGEPYHDSALKLVEKIGFTQKQIERLVHETRKDS